MIMNMIFYSNKNKNNWTQEIDFFLFLLICWLHLFISAVLCSHADWLRSCHILCDSKSVSHFFYSMLYIYIYIHPSTEVVFLHCHSAVQLLHGWCHVKLLPSWHVLCTPYNHAPCYLPSYKVYPYIGCMPCNDACLAVTCHLHFWQNDQDLYVPLQ